MVSYWDRLLGKVLFPPRRSHERECNEDDDLTHEVGDSTHEEKESKARGKKLDSWEPTLAPISERESLINPLCPLTYVTLLIHSSIIQYFNSEMV